MINIWEDTADITDIQRIEEISTSVTTEIYEVNGQKALSQY